MHQMMRAAIAAFWLLGTDNVWMAVGAVPFWDKLRVKKSAMITWMVAVALLQSVMSFVVSAYGHDWPVEYGLLVQGRKAIYYGLIVLFYLVGFRVHWTQLVYVFMFLVSAATLVNTVAYTFLQFVLGWGAAISYSQTPAYPALIMALNVPACLFIGRYFVGAVRPALEELSPRETLALCGIPALIMVVTMVVNAITYSVSNTPAMALLNLLVMVAGLAAFILNMRLMRESGQRARLAAENAAMSQMLDLQQKGYAQLADGIERARAQRHDMRFHLNVLSGYIGENALAKAAAYLNEYRAALDENTMPRLCSNNAVNILACHYVGQIQALGASADVRLQLPEDAGVPDADLCVIFGNLLENALHGLKGQGPGASLRAHCEADGGSIVLTVDNTCPGAPDGPAQRGIGLSSVANLAAKHQGIAQFEYRGGVFQASVILNAHSGAPGPGLNESDGMRVGCE